MEKVNEGGAPRPHDESSSNESQEVTESSPLVTSSISVDEVMHQNVDIIGILNSPTASATPSRSLAPLLPLVGTPNRNVKVHSSREPLTPDHRRTDILESQKQVSYSSIANADFPAIEVTVDSGSSDSQGSSYTPLSPLTPSYTVSDGKKMTSTNRASNSSADNLVNVLEKITSKQVKQQHKALNGNLADKNMDVDDNDRYAAMGKGRAAYDPSGTPRKQNEALSNNKCNPFHLNLDSSSSSCSSDDEGDNDESTNTPTTRNEGFGLRKNEHNNRHPSGDHNRNGNVKRKIFGGRKYDYRQKLTRNTSVGSHATTNSYQHQQRYSEYPQPSYRSSARKVKEPPTLHAQTFVLSLAFFALWSPQNLMAPNLTQMAEYFHFSPEQRDLYLGANIAFATGVLSLPVSAMLGFLADVVASRKRLYAFTVMASGFAGICTGLSETYAQLYFARYVFPLTVDKFIFSINDITTELYLIFFFLFHLRFVCGGCMAGAVPIAFSLLGDFFDAKDRNAASSGLTAMMGAGILSGQVFAGMVGDVVGWKQPFYVSGAMSIVTSLMVMVVSCRV